MDKRDDETRETWLGEVDDVDTTGTGRREPPAGEDLTSAQPRPDLDAADL